MVACIFGTTRSALSIRSKHALTETFVLRHAANGVNLCVDICRNELAVSTHAAL